MDEGTLAGGRWSSKTRWDAFVDDRVESHHSTRDQLYGYPVTRDITAHCFFFQVQLGQSFRHLSGD